MRRFLALVCMTAIFLAALSPISLGAIFAFLIPIWFLFAFVLSLTAASVDEESAETVFGFVPVFSPRPPPIR